MDELTCQKNVVKSDGACSKCRSNAKTIKLEPAKHLTILVNVMSFQFCDIATGAHNFYSLAKLVCT